VQRPDTISTLCFIHIRWCLFSSVDVLLLSNSQSRLHQDCNAQWCPREMFRIITIVYCNVGGLIFTIFFFFLVCALFCCLTPALYFQSNFNSINVTFVQKWKCKWKQNRIYNSSSTVSVQEIEKGKREIRYL